MLLNLKLTKDLLKKKERKGKKIKKPHITQNGFFSLEQKYRTIICPGHANDSIHLAHYRKGCEINKI